MTAQSLPWPTVDTWASSTMHVLPAYLTDFWGQISQVPRHRVLWANPRFSQLHRLLQLWKKAQLHGYVLFPEWPAAVWWDTVHTMASSMFTVEKGTCAFVGLTQDYPRRCPWNFFVAYIDCRPSPSVQLPVASSALPSLSGQSTHGSSRRGRDRRARLQRLIHIHGTYPLAWPMACALPALYTAVLLSMAVTSISGGLHHPCRLLLSCVMRSLAGCI